MGILAWAGRLDDWVGRRIGVDLRAPSLSDDDAVVIARWRELHPVEPWRGHDGRGGLLGWANRLDEGIGVRLGLTAAREKSISIPAKEILREFLRSPVRWYWLIGLPVAITLDALTPGPDSFSLFFALGVTTAAAARVRRRWLAAMRKELDSGPDSPAAERASSR